MKMVYSTVTMRMSRAVLLFFTLTICANAADIRLGIIGTDVSHVIHFTRILNNANDPEHISGARVVAAYKSSSPDIESSRTRVEALRLSSKRTTAWNWSRYRNAVRQGGRSAD